MSAIHQHPSNHRQTLNIRIKPAERNLIDLAAQLQGKNRTDFILDATRVAAEQVILDQVMIGVNHKVYEAFIAKLDAPPKPNKRLIKTMQTPPPWKKK